jgi:4-amino-4-deoxy-L-arabinose transferase-like glycosyltransferase
VIEKIKAIPKINWILLGAIAVGLTVFQALPGPRPLDDAYITFRYARNISDGLGFVYNAGEHVLGTTTPLYTLLLALLAHFLGSDQLPAIAFAISLVADGLNVWLVFRLARYALKNDLAALAAALVFLLQPLRLNVATSGMETSLFLLLLLATYDRVLVRPNLYLATFFGCLAILTRVDAVLAVGPALIYAGWKNRRQFIRAAGLGLLLLLPWVVWSTWYFGSPLPFSVVAKSAAYQNMDTGATLVFLLTFLGTGTVGPYEQLLAILPGLGIFTFFAIFGVRYLLNHSRETLVVVSYPILYFLGMVFVHGPIFFTWYYPPLMPGLLILLVGGEIYLGGRLNARARLASLGGLSLGLIIVPALLLYFLPGWGITRSIEGGYQVACQRFDRAVQPGQLVFAPDIGVLGWCLGQARILDPIGLVSPESIPFMKGRSPLDSSSPELVYTLKPDFIVSRRLFIRNFLVEARFQQDYRLVWQQPNPDLTGEGDQVLGFERR